MFYLFLLSDMVLQHRYRGPALQADLAPLLQVQGDGLQGYLG